MSKRCITLTPCAYEGHCKHRAVPQNQTTQFFSPPHTGEHCSYYEPRDVDSDPWHGLSNMMGAVE